MRIVISMGGSLLTKDLSAENFQKYADVFMYLKDLGHKLIVVCGGGKVCRDYRDIGKALGGDNDQLDFIGMMATHINAATLAAAIKGSHLIKPMSLEEATKEVGKNFGKKILVGAGYRVGNSTDYDAAVFAEAIKADLLINASNVDGIYTADPKKDRGATKLDRVSYDEFERIMGQNEQVAGEYRFFDLPATKLIKKARIKTVFINGNDPDEIKRAVDGTHHGSIVE